MGYKLSFIGLKRLKMVERLVGEVAMRSPKERSRALLTQVSRDKARHEDFVLEDS